MSVLYIALPAALVLGGAAVGACLRCIQAGQYDDLDTPAVRMLIDDPVSRRQPTNSASASRGPAQ